MNLLSQLTAATGAIKSPRNTKPANWARATEAARLAQTAKAIRRYQAVMQGRGWLTQSQIEGALGYAATVSTGFLHKLHEKLKLIERRNRNGAAKFDRRTGYEWRWIDGN